MARRNSARRRHAGTATGGRRAVAAVLLLLLGLVLAAPGEARQKSAIERGIETGLAARQTAQAGRFDEALSLSRKAEALLLKAGAQREWPLAILVIDRADFLVQAQRSSEARDVLDQALRLTEDSRWDSEEAHFQALVKLGSLQRALGRPGEALGVYRKAEARLATVKNPETRADLLRRLSGTFAALDRYREADDYWARALASTPETAAALRVAIELDGVQIAIALRDLARAQALLDHIRDEAPPASGSSSFARMAALHARLEARQARFAAAVTRLNEALAALRRPDRPRDLDDALLLDELSSIHTLRGDSSEAIETQLQVMALYEQSVGPDHPLVAQSHHNLALAYRAVGDLEKSGFHFDRAVRIEEKSLGRASLAVGLTLSEEARLRSMEGKSAEALEIARNAVSILRSNPNTPPYKLALVTAGSGMQLRESGLLDEARATFATALGMMERDPFPSPADMIPSLNNLAEMALEAGRFDEARTYAARASDYVLATGSLGVHENWRSRRILAEIELKSGHASESLRIMEEELAKQETRLRVLGNTPSEASEFESDSVRQDVETYLQAARAVEATPEGGVLLGQMFTAAQLPTTTQTGRAINGASARLQTDDPHLADLISRRQALAVERKASDRLLSNSASGDAGGAGRQGLADLRARIDALDGKIAALDAELAASHPDFVSLLEPKSAALGAVQAALEDDEALLLQLTFDDATQLFYVTRTGARRVERPLGAAALDAMVSKLRSSLDFDGIEIPPYEAGIASDLYAAIFAPFDEDMRRIRHLIFVPDQAMTSLPPAVLLASPFAGGRQAGKGDWAALDYFGRHLAISIMPSADSFVALRSIPTDTRYARSFVGIGNPILPPMPKSAREDASLRRDDGILDWHLTDIKLDNLFDTEIELKDFAKLLGGDDASLYVRGEASETNVKAAPLDGVGTIAFATHGLLANDIRGLDEPALVLSMPDHPNSLDDGFLTATEIASLKIRSDLVVLSACNTAGRDSRPGAPGLSGLTRAFFYAGARSLMVTHWRIASTETVPLTTGFMAMRQAEPKERPSELLRRAMDEMITGRAGSEAGLDPVTLAHPGVWGSFVIVGDR